MSEYKVPFTTIKEIKKHPNADRLEVAVVYGYEVVVQKGRFQVGNMVCYIPVDSILPQDLQNLLFTSDSKIKPIKHRIRQIKIRQFYSQGMLIDFETTAKFLASKGINRMFILEEDLAVEMGVTKYDPGPAPFEGANTSVRKRDKPKENPYFHKYNGVENIKWYPDLFTADEEIVIQEKLHGSCCRAAYLPFQANTLWKKVKKLFGLAPKNEYCYGSNNVQLQERTGYKGFYGEDVYGNVLKKVDAFSKIKLGETIYGELIGEGIQKDYHYGHKEHHFVLYDVKVMGEDGVQKWLSPEEAQAFAKERGFDFVPVLYTGKFNKEKAHELTKGDSVYCPIQKVIEGVVIKSRFGYNDERMSTNKRCLKYISEKYLDGDQTDFH